jgi:hypothetical protein
MKLTSLFKRKKPKWWGREETISICHDIEAGLGHIGIDPEFSERASRTYLERLERMLAIEKEMGLRVSYNMVGLLFENVREMIERDGHCITFHSYDYYLSKDILSNLRVVDINVKEYRTPRSLVTEELNETNLSQYDFEWLASSATSLGIELPVVQNGIVKIPIRYDDFELHERKIIRSQKTHHVYPYCIRKFTIFLIY